jgi:hypothetical protein
VKAYLVIGTKGPAIGTVGKCTAAIIDADGCLFNATSIHDMDIPDNTINLEVLHETSDGHFITSHGKPLLKVNLRKKKVKKTVYLCVKQYDGRPAYSVFDNLDLRPECDPPKDFYPVEIEVEE